jgi:hypothetical protein
MDEAVVTRPLDDLDGPGHVGRAKEDGFMEGNGRKEVWDRQEDS